MTRAHDIVDYERFADELAALLDKSHRTGMHVTKNGNSAVIEGRLGSDWVRLEMEAGAFGVAEGWHVVKNTRAPRWDAE